MKRIHKVTMVVPTIAKDIPKLLNNLERIFENLLIDKICIVATEDVVRMLPGDDRLIFVPESQIVDFNKIKSLISKRAGRKASKRTGWYVQQFIKMGFCRITDDDYYLLWDSDTIPVKKISLFDENGIPYLDYKTEFHQAYFDTIQSLLPGYKKEFKGSFIAEHMLISSEYMKNLLCKIESNNRIAGSTFEEKIINSICEKDIAGSGFSEFETYGTYVYKEYRNRYILRKWRSMRFGGFFFEDAGSISHNEMKWLSGYYDAISFEKGDTLSAFSSLVHNDNYINHFGARSLEILSFIIRAKRKLTTER